MSFALTALLAAFYTPAQASTPAVPPGQPVHFLSVSIDNRCAPGQGVDPADEGIIFRGGAPDGEAGVEFLSDLDVVAIVNLEETSEIDPAEISAANSLSIQELFHPMVDIGVNETPTGAYDNESIISAVAELAKPANFPLYVHCQHGLDRTGMTVAFHRVFHECWAPQDAQNEWQSIAGPGDVWNTARFAYFQLVTGDPRSALYQQFASELETH